MRFVAELRGEFYSGHCEAAGRGKSLFARAQAPRASRPPTPTPRPRRLCRPTRPTEPGFAPDERQACWRFRPNSSLLLGGQALGAWRLWVGGEVGERDPAQCSSEQKMQHFSRNRRHLAQVEVRDAEASRQTSASVVGRGVAGARAPAVPCGKVQRLHCGGRGGGEMRGHTLIHGLAQCARDTCVVRFGRSTDRPFTEIEEASINKQTTPS